MKQHPVKAIITTAEHPVAANGNSWEPRNKTLPLRTVLREWQAEYEETTASVA